MRINGSGPLRKPSNPSIRPLEATTRRTATPEPMTTSPRTATDTGSPVAREREVAAAPASTPTMVMA